MIQNSCHAAPSSSQKSTVNMCLFSHLSILRKFKEKSAFKYIRR